MVLQAKKKFAAVACLNPLMAIFILDFGGKSDY